MMALPLLAQLSMLASTVFASAVAFHLPTSQAFLSFHVVPWSSAPATEHHRRHGGTMGMTRSAREIRRRSLNEPCTSGRLREVLKESITGGPTSALLAIVSRLRGCPLSAVCTNEATSPELHGRRRAHYCRFTRDGTTCSIATGPLLVYDPRPRKRHDGHISHPKNRQKSKQDDDDDLDMLLASLNPLPKRTYRPNTVVDEFTRNINSLGNNS